MTAKPTGTQPTVNAALVHRQFAFLPGEICTEGGAFDDDRPGSDHTGIPRPKRCGELPAACEESAAIIIGVTARRVVTRGVRVQKSAAAIVVFRYFTRVADHEGPNMRSRTEQWAARSSTMKPDRASRERRRLKMPVLCAFCAQPVRVRIKLCMNRPLRTRTVGGVGAGG